MPKSKGKKNGNWSVGAGQFASGGSYSGNNHYGQHNAPKGHVQNKKNRHYEPPVPNGIKCPLCGKCVEAEGLSSMLGWHFVKKASEHTWSPYRGYSDSGSEDEEDMGYGQYMYGQDGRSDYGHFYKHMLSHIEFHFGSNTWGNGGKQFMGDSTDDDCEVDRVEQRLGSSAQRVGRLMAFSAGLALDRGVGPPGGWPLTWEGLAQRMWSSQG